MQASGRNQNFSFPRFPIRLESEVLPFTGLSALKSGFSGTRQSPGAVGEIDSRRRHADTCASYGAEMVLELSTQGLGAKTYTSGPKSNRLNRKPFPLPLFVQPESTPTSRVLRRRTVRILLFCHGTKVCSSLSWLHADQQKCKYDLSP